VLLLLWLCAVQAALTALQLQSRQVPGLRETSLLVAAASLLAEPLHDLPGGLVLCLSGIAISILVSDLSLNISITCGSGSECQENSGIIGNSELEDPDETHVMEAQRFTVTSLSYLHRRGSRFRQ